MEKEIKDLQDKLDALKLRYKQSKQPFKNGDVVETYSGAIFLITDVENNRGYGFSSNGIWFSENNLNINLKNDNLKLYTSEKWLEALTKEAVKRGFKVGDKIKTPLNNATGIIDENYKEFDLTSDGYFYHHNMLVFYNGIWASLIKEETLEELAQRYFKVFDVCDKKQSFITFFNENKETINRLSK